MVCYPTRTPQKTRPESLREWILAKFLTLFNVGMHCHNGCISQLNEEIVANLSNVDSATQIQ